VAFHDERLQGPGLFTRDIRTIWVSNLRRKVFDGGVSSPGGKRDLRKQTSRTERSDAIRRAVLALASDFGQITASQPCKRGVPGLLIQYRLRTQAEFAREAMHRQKVEGCVLVVRWSVDNILAAGAGGILNETAGGRQRKHGGLTSSVGS